MLSLVFQNVGGTFFLSAAQAAFINTMIANVRKNVPTVDPISIVTTGATQNSTMYNDIEVPGIMAGYMACIKVALAISISGAGVALIVSFVWRLEET
jgi:hypothetical protein